MTWHDGEPTDDAFRAFRASLEPLELSGKLRGVLLQYHPRVKKTPDAMAELERVPERLAPLVPLIEFRHRSWMEEDEREDTLAFLERSGLAYVSVDSPRTRASNVMPRVAAATHAVAYVRFHGRNTQTWNIRGGTSADRFDWLYSPEELEEWVGPVQRLAEEADEVYALFNNNRDDFAPRSAATFRGLLDESGVPATGGIEPPPTRADAVLSRGTWVDRGATISSAACASSRSSTTRHGRAAAGCSRPSRSRPATRTSAGWRPNGPHEADPAAYDAIMVFGGAMHPDQDAEHPWLPGEAAFIGAALEARVPLLGVCLGSQLIARAAGARDRPGGDGGGRLVPGRAERCRTCRPGARRAAATRRGVRVALLHLRRCPPAARCSPRATPRARPTASATTRGGSSSTRRSRAR